MEETILHHLGNRDIAFLGYTVYRLLCKPGSGKISSTHSGFRSVEISRLFRKEVTV